MEIRRKKGEELEAQFKVETWDIPEDKWGYLSVYMVTRQYGGPEEGGWYYNWYECVATLQVVESDLVNACRFLFDMYAGRAEGNIYSVLGGTMVAIYLDDAPAKSETKKAQHFE
jgi:hypothetical protein